MKNFFQKIVALIIIILTLPLQLLIFILLLIELKEFPIFTQKRGLTLEKNIFTIFKFKTLNRFQENKIFHKTTNDIFYITSNDIKIKTFSKLLRVTGLDEILQFYNIFLGNMNLIGPRPLMLEELTILKNEYPIFYQMRNNFKSKPGLTGLWQVYGDRKKGIEDLIKLDSFYEDNQSLKLDLKILYHTFIITANGKNSDAIISK